MIARVEEIRCKRRGTFLTTRFDVELLISVIDRQKEALEISLKHLDHTYNQDKFDIVHAKDCDRCRIQDILAND